MRKRSESQKRLQALLKSEILTSHLMSSPDVGLLSFGNSLPGWLFFFFEFVFVIELKRYVFGSRVINFSRELRSEVG